MSDGCRDPRTHHHALGAVLTLQVAGAGGYGDTRDRDPEAVRGDVRNEIVSPSEAKRVYGVDAG